MKIAVFEPYIEGIGGAQKVILKYCLYLQSQGHTVEIFTQRYNPQTAHSDFSKIKINLITPKNKILSGKAFSRKFDGFDIYVTNDFPSNFVSIYNNPSVWVCYSPKRDFYDLKEHYDNEASTKGKIALSLKRLLFKKKDKLAAQRNTRILPISKTVSNRVKKYYGINTHQRICCGIDVLDYEYKEPKNYILCVSRLVKHKRIDLAIKAMKLIKNKNTELYIVGEGPEEENLKQLADGNDNIKFLGPVDDDKLIELYSECLGVVFTPLDEDWGLIALEAAASGKPVIGANEGGLTETIIDNVTGFLIEPTPENIAEKIKILSIDRQLTKDMGIEARKYVTKFDWEKSLQAFEKQLIEVANQ